MRLRDIPPAHHRLLAQIASGISGRLDARFVELPGDAPDAQIGVELHEGSRNVVIELSVDLLIRAIEGPGGREALRTRVKARRDRMMFKTPPPLPRKVAAISDGGSSRHGSHARRR